MVTVDAGMQNGDYKANTYRSEVIVCCPLCVYHTPI